MANVADTSDPILGKSDSLAQNRMKVTESA